MTYMHVVNGDIAADAIRQVLAAAQRSDPILVVRDDLTVGPLRGIDDASTARIAFWQRVLGTAKRSLDADFKTASRELQALMEDGSDVVLWHGPSASDQLSLRRLAYQLRTMPQRLNEIGLTVAELGAGGRPGGGSASIGAYPLSALGARLTTIAPISLLRIGRLALEWQELKQLNNELRRWRNNTFQSGSFSEIDARLIEQATPDWQSWTVLAAALWRHGDDYPVTDTIIQWRCRELAGDGKLEIRTAAAGQANTTEIRRAV